MKTTILIQKSVKNLNVVLFCRESVSVLVEGTFEDYLKNDSHWGQYTWEHEEGKEGSDYVEYTCGDITASYAKSETATINDGSYTPFEDESLFFLSRDKKTLTETTISDEVTTKAVEGCEDEWEERMANKEITSKFYETVKFMDYYSKHGAEVMTVVTIPETEKTNLMQLYIYHDEPGKKKYNIALKEFYVDDDGVEDMQYYPFKSCNGLMDLMDYVLTAKNNVPWRNFKTMQVIQVC